MTIGTLISKGEIKISDTCKYISDMKENNTTNNYKIRALITIEVQQWTFCYTVFITQLFQKNPPTPPIITKPLEPCCCSEDPPPCTWSELPFCVSGFPWELRWAVRRFCVVPNSLLTPPPTPTSLCLCPLTQQPSLSLSRSSSRTVTDSALFCRRSHAPPLPHPHPGRGDTVLKYLFWQIIKGDAT